MSKGKKSPYPYIKAYGHALGSYPSFIEEQIQKAIAANCPADTWAVREDGNHFTTSNTSNPNLKKELDLILAYLGMEDQIITQ